MTDADGGADAGASPRAGESASPLRPPLAPPAATLAIIGAAFGFASITIATIIATRQGTPLGTVILGRFLVAALLLLPFTGGVRGLRIARGRATELIVKGGTGQVLVNLLSLSALAYIPAATLVFLFYTYPAWVTVLAALRGSERITPGRLAALALSIAGIVVTVGAPGGDAIAPLGVALALAAALLYALYIPLIRRLQDGLSPMVATIYIAIGVSILLGTLGIVRGELTWRMPWPSVAAIFWLAAVSTVAAFYLFMRGLATLGSVRTAIASTAEPFFAAVMAAVILDQPLTAGTMAGGVLIASAVLLLQLRDR